MTISSTPATSTWPSRADGSLRDHDGGDRAADVLRRRHELERDRPHLAAEVLRDDEDARHQVSRSLTISAIRWATAAGLPFSISAPSPFGGTNMRRTRAGRLAEVAGLDDLDLLLLGLLDRAQGRVAGLVDAGLDRQHGRRVDLDDVDEAALPARDSTRRFLRIVVVVELP